MSLREDARRRILNAAPGANGNGHAPKPPPTPPPPPETVIKSVEGIPLAEVSWLWDLWLPRGTLSILDGDPGLGKSTLTLDIAARVSRGWAMPPGGGHDPEREPAGVLLLSAEDDPGYTIRPRLEAAGADLSRIHLFEGIKETGGVRPPVLPWDLGLVAERARALCVRLITIDPFTAFLGGEFDAHKDQDIRRCLHQLELLARQLGASIWLVRHLNKLNGGPALYRGGGSIAITGAARASMVVGRSPDDEHLHVLAMNKSNLGPMPVSLAYRIEQAGPSVTRLAWQGEIDLHAADILWHRQGRTPGRPDDQTQEAQRFLADLLCGGPVLATEVLSAANANMVSERTLNRAKQALKIQSYQTRDGWWWKLP